MSWRRSRTCRRSGRCCASRRSRSSSAPSARSCGSWSTPRPAGCTRTTTSPAPRPAAGPRAIRTSSNCPHDADTRSIIVAAPGHVLVGVDYSQMELRAAAWISGDAELTGAYEQGDDVHVLTAAAINGIDPEEVTKEQRAAAKAVNFGSIYGMGPTGLVRRLVAITASSLPKPTRSSLSIASSRSTRACGGGCESTPTSASAPAG